MDIKEFGMLLTEEMRSRFGKEYIIEYKEVIKNNRVPYHAVVVHKLGLSIAPTIYIESYYEMLQRGVTMAKITDQIMMLYRESMPSKEPDVSFFTDFAKVAEHLSFKLVNYAKNKERLKEIPYRKFEDLALVPICILNDSTFGSGTITISYQHIRLWEISVDELWENVIEYSPSNNPISIKSIVESIGRDRILVDENETIPGILNDILVISNKSGVNGAGGILYPGVLKQLSDYIEGDFAVIPSSIHECIAMPLYGDANENIWLSRMVKEVNGSVISEEEILSDNVYIYRRDEGKLRIYA